MKAFLINVPVKFNSWQNLEMPLGVAYIASEMESNGHEVLIRDYEVEPFEKAHFISELNSFKPDAVGISFRSSSYASAKRLCSIIRERKPCPKIILGGHHATAFAAETLKDSFADFVVRGEGEYVTAQLLAALSSGFDLAGVPNITYRRGGDIVSNFSAEVLTDLDALAFPAWHLLPMDRYVTGSILTSRGCPFSCIYCDKGVSTRKVKFRSPKNIYREIAAFEKKYRKGRIYFVDDYFLLDKRRLSELFNFIINDGDLKFKWYCQARVDGIDGETLRRARESGCEMIIYGLETGDEDELEYINKKATLEEAERAVRLSREAGIRTRANFMIGFPISTHKTIGNSIRFARRVGADLYRFFIVSPLPNTVLWDRIEKLHPEIAEVSWEGLDFYSPSFDTADVSKEELLKYVMAAYLYVLRGKVLRELTVEFIPRLLKFLFLAMKNRRMRGNLSVAFPACVNLFLEEWFLFRRLGEKERLRYAREIFAAVKRIRDG